MVMIKNFLLRLFGLSDIVAEQAFEIDALQMQLDLCERLLEIQQGKYEVNDVY